MMGVPRMTAPIMALKAATVVPRSKSQSTAKEFNTKISPTSVVESLVLVCE